MSKKMPEETPPIPVCKNPDCGAELRFKNPVWKESVIAFRCPFCGTWNKFNLL